MRNRDAATITPNRFDAVIFDLDGVITDTAAVHAAAWKALFDEYLRARAQRDGEAFHPFDADADYRRYVDGKPRDDGVRSFLESRSILLPFGDPEDPSERATVRSLGSRKNRYFLERLEQLGPRPYPSTLALIRALRGHGFGTAVISSSRNCGPILDAAGIRDLFDVKIDGADTDDLGLVGKPDPAIFLAAAARLGVLPARTAVVEDALSGVEAGRRGQFGLVIGVDRTGHAAELYAHGADVVVRDLAEVHVDLSGGAAPALPATRAVREIPPALDSQEAIAVWLGGRSLAVFLDYDGTLTRIVAHPDLALLSAATRRVLQRLAARCSVAVISGRDLADVRERVAVQQAVYAGSHGFEVSEPDGRHHTYAPAERFLPALDAAERDLRRPIAAIPGAHVDRKRFGIAVHYRQVAAADVERVERCVDSVGSAHPQLRKTGGKKVFELRPDVDWGKGRAVLWLLAELGMDGADVVPVFIGDDVTDEDAFTAIGDRGLTVVVGHGEQRSAAQYAVPGIEAVRTFLKFLLAQIEAQSP